MATQSSKAVREMLRRARKRLAADLDRIERLLGAKRRRRDRDDDDDDGDEPDDDEDDD